MTSYTYEQVELGDEHAFGCKCCRISNGVDLPIPKKLSIDEIRNYATGFSTSILKDWVTLNAIVKRFEPSIQKRWLRKNPKQRRELLLKAWPDMSSTHRPDFMGFRNLSKNAKRSKTLRSTAFLWPYINLEDLSQRHLLLLFLNSRGRNFPDQFVSADTNAAHLGHGWKSEREEESNFIQFHNQRTPRTYGKLVTPKTASNKHDCGFHPALGLLVLEIQQRIYGFLLSCTQLILHDIHPRQYFLAICVPALALPEAPQSDWPSLATNMLETPYRAPQKMDLERLTLLVGARRASAEDHLWLLREDPGYFIETLKEWKEHDEAFLKHSCNRCWYEVTERMVGDALTIFLFWDWIYRRLAKMPPIESEIRRAHSSTEEQRWVELLSVIKSMMFLPIDLLTLGLAPSPRMRHCFNFDQPVEKRQRLWDPKRKLNEAENRVETLFYAITNDELRELHGLNHLVQEVQYMLETDNEAGQLVDSWVIGLFSDLAMLSELQTRIEGLKPWSTAWETKRLDQSKPVAQNVGKLYRLDSTIRLALGEICGDTIIMNTILGDPTDGSFDYPAPKRHTEANVNQMRFAEACLDDFWNALERGIEAYTGYNVFQMLERRLREPRKIYRTAEWMPPLEEIISYKAKQPLQERDANVATPRMTSCASKTEISTTPKVKVKTRGIAAAPAAEEVCPSPAVETPPSTSAPQMTIKVPKRAYKVLSALLPAGKAECHQRIEIAWEEFLQAMNTIGLQPEKLYGSVWIFMPKHTRSTSDDEKAKKYWVDVNRSIQYHEPKEVRRGGKIPTHYVRTFGRRLKHAYGWGDGMFVCE